MHQIKHQGYRSDIDGLRAIAVLLVIIFHCNASWLPGGFVGVDVFFVISGFLITNIILNSMGKGNFSLAAFHGSRIRRIFPAYLVVILFTLIVGIFLLVPDDFRALDKSAYKSILLVPNMHFASKLDYFSPQAEEMPLLHLWSLGVELQFYVIWPLVLILMHRLGCSLKMMLTVTLGLACGSLAYSEWLLASQNGSKAYYLFPSRASALLVGCALAMYERLRNSDDIPFALYFQGLGLALIFFSAFMMGDMRFPGVNILWPSLGAALIIFAGNQSTVLTRMISLRPMVYIGLISYSLYLWHWPLLAYFRYVFGVELELSLIVVAMLITWGLAHLSKQYIELPIQKKTLSFRGAWVRYHLIPGFLMLLVIVAPSKATNGMNFRSELFSSVYATISDEEACYKKLKGDCKIGSQKGRDSLAVFVGDSHSAHFEPLLEKLALRDDSYVVSRTTSNCDSIAVWSGDGGQDKRCRRLAKLLSGETHRYQILILAGRWDARLSRLGRHDFEESYMATMSELSERFERIIVLAQMPKYEKDAFREVVFNYRFEMNADLRLDQGYIEANKLVEQASKHFDKVEFVDLGTLLCAGENCLYQIEGKPLYKDDDHLNNFGGQYLAELIDNNEALLRLF